MRYLRKTKKMIRAWIEAKAIAEKKVSGSEHKERIAKYTEYYNTLKIEKNTIVYESFSGRGINDNPYALFLGIVSREEFSSYKHIWVLDDLEEKQDCINLLKNYSNVFFVQYQSDQYLRAIASAEYLINNVTFPLYFTKKKGQVYINTWHGTALKKMGFEVPNGRTGAANIVRNFLCADYLLSANESMTDMYLNDNRLEGLYEGEIIQTGYPRNDVFFSDTKKEKMVKRLKDNGIIIDENKKIVLYAPTWRGTAEKTEDTTRGLLKSKEALEANIDTDEYQILIKPHQLVYQLIKDDKRFCNSIIPGFFDANEVLSITDVLISDYSSIFVDYLITERPILFYTPDKDKYDKKRGIKEEFFEMPGPRSDSLTEIASMICNVEEACGPYKKTYQIMKDMLTIHDDGNVTNRIIDYIWHGKKEGIAVRRSSINKPKLLISGAHALENGITHSLISLTRQLDYEKWDITILVEIGRNTKRIRDLINNEIDERARVLVRKGTFGATKKEETHRSFIMKCGTNNKLVSYLYPHKLYEREWKRLLGDVGFDYIVDFNGYAVMYAPMLLHGKAKKRSIWMHSDIMADMNREVNGEKPLKEKLKFIMSLYPQYDYLVSCANAVKEINEKKINRPELRGKFRFAKNAVNIKRINSEIDNEKIVSIKQMDLVVKTEIDEMAYGTRLETLILPSSPLCFVTMGRLSPEKNHEALIRAFRRFLNDNAEAQLYILGDGPLRSKMFELVEELDLSKNVYLPGNVSNPFSIIKRSSCFILPSFYEGQPMVLMEARACNVPIIVSDFETVKDSLLPEGQLVIHTDEDSIYGGLCAFKEGKIPQCEFSIESYNKEAYEEFYNAIQ